LLATPALNIASRLCTNSERGLLGIAVDPAFASNRFIYLYYTLNKTGSCDSTAVNRVARFILADNNTVDTASEQVLIDNIQSNAGNHNGGDLHFGKDGFLYVSVGDGGCDYAGDSGCAGANDASRDRHVLLGKILRVTRDGAIPATNPFQGANSGRCNVAGITTAGNWCQETFASGPAKSFSDRVRPERRCHAFLYQRRRSEYLGRDRRRASREPTTGGTVREGHCANGSTTNCGAPPAGMTNPIFDYGRGCTAGVVTGNSITGGAFVPAGIWPAEYDGSYLFSEYCLREDIQARRQMEAAGTTRANLRPGLAAAAQLR
jgi:hypothetical protein